MLIKILLWLTTYQKISINKLNNKQHPQTKNNTKISQNFKNNFCDGRVNFF